MQWPGDYLSPYIYFDFYIKQLRAIGALNIAIESGIWSQMLDDTRCSGAMQKLLEKGGVRNLWVDVSVTRNTRLHGYRKWAKGAGPEGTLTEMLHWQDQSWHGNNPTVIPLDNFFCERIMEEGWNVASVVRYGGA